MTDIYFNPKYGKIWAKLTKAKFINFEYSHQGKKITYPFLLRKIDSNWNDITSPYGYSGPLSNTLDLDFYQDFRQSFTKFCHQNNVVSEFIRCHPLLKNHLLAKQFLKTVKINQTVWVDLQLPLDTIWANFRQLHRRKIKLAQKNGVTIKTTRDLKKIQEWCQIYQQTMKRKQAETFYFFPNSLFTEHFIKLKNQVFLMYAETKGKMIAGSIFLIGKSILHYHFGATQSDYLNLSPTGLIFWSAIQFGKKLNFIQHHLGGGVKANDSLLNYKLGFSKKTADFYSGEVILNLNVYNQLCQKSDQTEGDFFPLYRQHEK